MQTIETVDGKFNIIFKSKTLSESDYEDMVNMFVDIYDDMYNNGYHDLLVEVFDCMMENNSGFENIVYKFNEHTNDFISSDREAAAFVYMLSEMGIIHIQES